MRSAIAMIELIFSIVIMGIVLLSAPMLISTASSTTTVALQQEGINEVASRINMILTHNWDEANNNLACNDSPSILNTSGDDELNRGANDRRSGTDINSSSHRFTCGGAGELNASLPLGREGNLTDDIDDFGDSSLVEITSTNTEGEDYIERNTVAIATDIAYKSDETEYGATTMTYSFDPADTIAGTTNIKSISVTLSSSHAAEELKGKSITMHAFSCNIGSFNYDRRPIP